MAISAATAAWHDILERVNRWRLGARSAAARRRRRAARDWRQAVARSAAGSDGSFEVWSNRWPGPFEARAAPSAHKESSPLILIIGSQVRMVGLVRERC